jgi:superfamily II DNA or RNA helicase
MLVLHASWVADRLHLWGERPPDSAPPASAVGCAYDPCGAGAVDLLRALRAVLRGGVRSHVRDASVLVAWLPTLDRRPVPSRLADPGTAAGDAGGCAASLAAWRVTALPLDWGDAWGLLAACGADRRLSLGVAAGSDLEAWADLLRFAGAIVARQSYLPGLVAAADETFESRWQPLLDGADGVRARELAARLPPAAFALARAGADAPPPYDPEAGGRAFLEETLDRLVRSAAVTTLTRAHASRSLFASAHDAWMASLRADDRRIRWPDANALRSLADAVGRWREPLETGSRQGHRLLARLDDPSRNSAGPDGRWRLRLFLETPGSREPIAALLPLCRDPRTAPDLRRFALVALGQAAAVCPMVAEAAEADGIDGLALGPDAAHAFLAEGAPALAAAGFGVGLPHWWRAADERPRLRLRGRVAASAAPLSLDALADVRWEAVLGGRRLTLREVEALNRSGVPLVPAGKAWTVVRPDEVAAARRALHRDHDRSFTVRDLLRLALGGTAHGLPVESVTASGSLKEVLDRLRGDAAPAPIPPPEGFTGTLRPYQLRGVAWLVYLRTWGLGACLADDMGLGKTVQTLALLAREAGGGPRGPTLLVCPTSVLGTWLRESARFTPHLRMLLHHGPDRDSAERLAGRAVRHDVVLTSYALLARDFAALRRVAWAGVVLDEAQNIKNPDTCQSQAARALAAGQRLALTGTPVENRASDLWAIMDFLNPGLLGTRVSFRQRFQVPMQTGTDPGALPRLRRLVQPFVLRRLKSDPQICADLPEKCEQKVFCPLTREQADLYAGVLRDLDHRLDGVEGIARRGLVLATLTRLKQICNHPAHFLADDSPLEGRSGKLARLDAMFEEVLAEGDRALIFTQYAVMGRLLQAHLRDAFGLEVPFLHGGVERAERDRLVARFQADDGPPAFVLSLRAGGTGLNLTAANRVFHFDRWWNPAVEGQATDRAHRIGQTRRVFVHAFVCSGTLEERIDAMLSGKAALARDLVGAGEAWLTELSNDRLRAVLALAQETVADEDW